jgi:hypothetical protein
MCDDDKEWLEGQIDSTAELARGRAGDDVLWALFERLDADAVAQGKPGVIGQMAHDARRSGFEQAILAAGRVFYAREIEGLDDDDALDALREACAQVPELQLNTVASSLRVPLFYAEFSVEEKFRQEDPPSKKGRDVMAREVEVVENMSAGALAVVLEELNVNSARLWMRGEVQQPNAVAYASFAKGERAVFTGGRLVKLQPVISEAPKAAIYTETLTGQEMEVLMLVRHLRDGAPVPFKANRVVVERGAEWGQLVVSLETELAPQLGRFGARTSATIREDGKHVEAPRQEDPPSKKGTDGDGA